MHLLVTQPGQITDGEEAVDLDQSPGDIIVLSSAASDLAILSTARGRLGDFPYSVRLANIMQLSHNMSVDLYLEKTITGAQLVVIRLLGGTGYWPYGVEQVRSLCTQQNIRLIVIPGDDRPDAELAQFSNVPMQDSHRVWQYFNHGGSANAENLLKFCSSILGKEQEWREPAPLTRAGLYWPNIEDPSIDDISRQWLPDMGIVPIVFYRALVQADDLAPIDALCAALLDQNLNPLPIYVSSLKDDFSAAFVERCLEENPPGVILNATGFAISAPGKDSVDTPFDRSDCAVLQCILSGGNEAGWQENTHGLNPRDLAMNVALPEVDGRLITRAISFKNSADIDPTTEVAIVKHQPVASRITFVAECARRWIDLKNTPTASRKIALIVANYPNKDGRLGNGVGLDTPAGVIKTVTRLAAEKYTVGEDIPQSASELMEILMSGPTNSGEERVGGKFLTVKEYAKYFATLPQPIQQEIEERWGPPEEDPFVVADNFILPVHQFGNVLVGVQPARGYNIDPVKSYHDPDLVPPHGYLAFYYWLREEFGAHAIIHFGKHGNLEWLPGKALALSENCYPEIAFGAVPHLYPFIVNDPGEGTQAKRRSQAVIVDHLTPPLTRAEIYGPLKDLEQLVDEYYQAVGMDPRRLAPLARNILSLSATIGLDRDVGIENSDNDNDALSKIDNYLCELKELQIRDGLHIFGKAPHGQQSRDLLIALTRMPRDDGTGENSSLIRALASDTGLSDFDPLDCTLGESWSGKKPDCLLDVTNAPWRTNGDTVERLELIAAALVDGDMQPEEHWHQTRSVLGFIDQTLRPAIESCGKSELRGLLSGLDGRFVPPGPSGAPTRGRLDVIPTGRNFYSVDCRAVPSPAAWQLGWKSATLLIERHFQDHGSYPSRIALSAWGTANMRTGGDDIAQALALMGVQPVWDKQANRVTGFEIMPASVLGRPRVDVVFRVSGFFRDAFPYQLDLIDSAARAVAALDEDSSINPLAAQTQRDQRAMQDAGYPEAAAKKRAGYRVFGSKPGAYGAGLQALIDEGCWESDEDLAAAYLAWGGYAYGGGSEGEEAQDLFAARLKNVEVVIHNQDNREHDLLDSDDYYQFEGGISAAVRHLSGTQPTIYHNDHNRPETPRIGTLQQEISCIVRARAANPKWINGVMRHGYKGAFEIAATVDYLFAFAATAKVVEDHHFDQVFDAYLGNEDVRQFIQENNAPALDEMAQRFQEAIERDLWHPRSNRVHHILQQLAGG
ncbi:MAG: cobaltochelatase subunit CobN [Rhodospirillaceae bacterium]|nr:cobaltochelatase subunit CobN [Rhodospirillaceae bacterium]|tara:strand:- start:162074 stop:165805 length:3732 start_codon:yes stop_codon:yes gene_type:complete